MIKENYKVKAIIFDMDGVITNTMPDHYRAWKFILNNHGVTITKHEIYKREGQPGGETLKDMSEMLGDEYDHKRTQQVLDEKEEYFKKIANIKFITGSRNFLKTLHRDGFKLALVTGTARHEVKKILPIELYDLFDYIVTGCEVKKGKPNPEPFLKALKGLDINADEGVVIENAPFGIESAKNAGLECFALETSLSKEYLSKADHIFSSIKDLQSKINFQLIS